MAPSKASQAMRRMAVALAIGMLALVASAAPAAAAPVPTTTSVAQAADVAGCPADSFCFYMHKDFGGHIFVIPAGAAFPNLHVYACPEFCDSPRHGAGDGNFGDQMSSWINNTNLSYCWWFDVNYSRFAQIMPPQQSSAWLGKHFQDEASSIQPC